MTDAEWLAARQLVVRVFDQLDREGVIAIAGAGFTQEMAFAACADAFRRPGHDGVWGWCFTTTQDMDRARATREMPIGFGGADGSDAQTMRVGERVCAAFRAAACEVEWAGTPDKRPSVLLPRDLRPGDDDPLPDHLLTASEREAAAQGDGDPRRLFELAVDYANEGAYSRAIDLFRQVIAREPANAQAHHELAMALIEDHPRDAVIEFERALAIQPGFPGSRDWLARTLRDLGDHRRAAELQLEELREHPDGKYEMGVSPQRWADCAESFAMAGQPARAIVLLEEYLAAHASRVVAYARDETAPLRVLARLLDEAGNVQRAAELRARARSSPHRVPTDD
jgi:hypothetical protein